MKSPKKSRKTSQPVPVVIQLAYNLTMNRPVGYNMAVMTVRMAIRDLGLPPMVTPEVVNKIVQYYDGRALPQLPKR